jgi:hypothetical protein
MAVGWPTKTTYANGDVYSASDVNDTNGTINLLTSTTLSSAAGKNAIINGGFDIWQRGTSITMSSTAYTADRWNGYRSVAGGTVTRQATGDTTNLPNIQYCARVSRDSGNTATTSLYFGQSVETSNAIPYAGKAITFSFYARKGANYSPTSSALIAGLYSGTGTDQNNTTGSYTGFATVAENTATLTTTWQRFTYTGTFAATATEFCVQFAMAPTGTAGAADYFEITGVQVELGSTATTFSRAGGTIQGELAACQRYYQRSTSGTSFGSMPVYAVSSTSTIIRGFVATPVSLRTIPTAVDFSALGWETNFGGSVTSISNATFYSTCGSAAAPVIEFTTTGVSASPVYYTIVTNNNAAGYLGLSAEL